MYIKFKIESKLLNDEVKLFVTHITFNEETYVFPEHLQSIDLHEHITTLQEVKNVIKTLSDKPDQFRYVKVTLNPQLLELYFVNGNPTFNTYSLEMLEFQQFMPSMTELLVLINRLQEELEQISKSKLEGKIMFNIVNDDEKIETLREFVSSSALDWYDSTLLKFGKSNWSGWMDSMKSVFCNGDWTKIRNAYNFRFDMSGEYVDYVLQKEKLILELNDHIPTEVLISLIVIGLPVDIQNELNKDEIQSTEKLIAELSRFEF
ncbi:hypothetical protein BLOT_005873 [Blomia tropicalis]|nr:hypothetical protein BLOT_005873 [Blomia tropicalis]